MARNYGNTSSGEPRLGGPSTLETNRANEKEAREQALQQAKRLRDDIMNFNAKKCEESMKHAEELIRKEKVEQALRRSSAQRSNRFSMMAMSVIVHNGFSADSMAMLIGLGIGSFLTSDPKHKVGKDNLTKAERKAMKVNDKLNKYREKLEDGEMVVPGMGRAETDARLESMQRARDRAYEKAGLHVPVTIDDAAVMIWGIKSRAVQDSLVPGANINEIRRDARKCLENVYTVCAADGLNRASIDGAVQRMGRMFDSDQSVHMKLNVPSLSNPDEMVYRHISSDNLSGAFENLVSGFAPMNTVRSYVYGDAGHSSAEDFKRVAQEQRASANSEPGERTYTADEVNDMLNSVLGSMYDAYAEKHQEPVSVEATVEQPDDEAVGVEAAEEDVVSGPYPMLNEGMDFKTPELTTPARLCDALDMIAGVDAEFFHDSEQEKALVGVYGNRLVLPGGYRAYGCETVNDVGELLDAVANAAYSPELVPSKYGELGNVVRNVVLDAQADGMSDTEIREGIVSHLRDVLVSEYGAVGVTNPYDGVADTFADMTMFRDDLVEMYERDPKRYPKEQLDADLSALVCGVANFVEGRIGEGSIDEQYAMYGVASAGIDDCVANWSDRLTLDAAMCGAGSKYRVMLAAYANKFMRETAELSEGAANTVMDVSGSCGIYCAPCGANDTGKVTPENMAERREAAKVMEDMVIHAYERYKRGHDTVESVNEFTRSMHTIQDELTPSFRALTAELEQSEAYRDDPESISSYLFPNTTGSYFIRDDLEGDNIVPLHWTMSERSVETYVEDGVVPDGLNDAEYHNMAFSRYDDFRRELKASRGSREISAADYAADFEPICMGSMSVGEDEDEPYYDDDYYYGLD